MVLLAWESYALPPCRQAPMITVLKTESRALGCTVEQLRADELQ